MKCKISGTSYIMNFMDTEGSSDKIIRLIENKFNNILDSNKYEGLEDWQTYYKVIYNNVRSILIYKGGASYPNENYKEIVIHIPIPTISEVPWGVHENQYIQDITQLDKKMRNFEPINVVFKDFATMENYLVDSISKAIEHTLKTGFTVGGLNVKIL